MKKSSFLITGATGLIGSHLMKSFEPEDVVYAVSRETLIKGATKTLKIDLGQPWSVSDLPGKVDTIIHLAQSEHYRDFPNWSEDVFSVNTLSTVKLLDYAREIGVKQFILASSGGVYGTGENSFSEDEDILAKGELGFYIGTRLCSEILSECYSNLMNIVCLRFFFAYGEGQRPNMLIPRLVESIKKGRPIQLKGDNGLSINPVYVSDAVNAIKKAMALGYSSKFNVAGPETLSLRQITEIIGHAVGAEPIYDVQVACGNADLVGNISRMTAELGEPIVRFKQGIQSYLDSLD